MVKLLVGKGGIVKCKDDDGNTPCDLAIQYDFYECKEVLEELAGEFLAFEGEREGEKERERESERERENTRGEREEERRGGEREKEERERERIQEETEER